MKPSSPARSRQVGRPLSFDRQVALGQAMLLFWRHGFEGTFLSDLTSAMGVSPPSLYAAFGDKKGLFREAVQLYLSGPMTSDRIIAEAPTAREAAAQLLRAAVTGYTGTDTPPGCLLATSTISCSAASADLQAELAAIRRDIAERLAARIRRAVDEGELAAEGTDPDSMAGHVMAVIQGLSTLARDGASREALLRIAETAMTAWPQSG